MNRRAGTRAAPHARAFTSLARIQSIRLLALVPVLVAAVINTGYQYLSSLERLGGVEDANWRDIAIRALGAGSASSGGVDVAIAGLVHVLPVLGIAYLVGIVWDRLFAQLRRRQRESGLLVTAVLLTLLMPPGVSVVHLAVGMSFAVIFGKGIFGGEGKTFLSPAVVGAAVMLISFPTALTNHPLWPGIAGYGGTRAMAAYQSEGSDGLALLGIDWWGSFFGNIPGLMGTTSVLAIVAGGAILVAARIASWRLILGQVIGLALVATLVNVLSDEHGVGSLGWHWHLVLGAFAFGAVFLATDPASAAATNTGRWIQGLIVGALVVLVRVGNPAHPDGVILAILMGSVLAPLIDHVVIWFNVRRRAREYG